MASEEQKTKADRLKAEGNALHLKGEHSAARSKYSEAIKLDATNSVLYANRAATYISLKQYLDAARDAQKAVDLDPNYGKGWARLGKSAYELHLFPLSIQAWNGALGTLPETGLSAQETRLKAQYEEGLKLAEETHRKFQAMTMEDNRLRELPKGPDVKMPWIRALELEDVLTTNNVLNTCAWPLMNAYKDFAEGVNDMKQLKKTQQGIEGNLNALQGIVGGILRDQRVFHMDAPNWIELLQLQVEFELTAFGGWPEGGAETVKEAAVKLLKEKGWKAVRLALASTIRAWFLRAYFADKTGQSKSVAMQYYNNVVDVLEWGTRTWHDVPTADRGYSFQPTYIRAIKRLRMEAYLTALRETESDETEHDTEDEPEYSVEELIDMANQMVEETTKNVPKDGDEDEHGLLDKGAWFSFHVFPIADAHATLGAVFMWQGASAKKDRDAEEAERMLAAAARFFRQAAEMYPPDDENFIYLLKFCFEAQRDRGRPLAETLPLSGRIRKALPAVAKIWEANPSRLLRVHIRQLDNFETRAYTGLLNGTYTMETSSAEVSLD